ncbi:hypothetical protein, partial [Succinimonas amylolytica]|uniref:hypothetical protein n=1 Tax=Succinimonas amylolytica TaxID=83769 RepID=UPI001B7FC155
PGRHSIPGHAAFRMRLKGRRFRFVRRGAFFHNKLSFLKQLEINQIQLQNVRCKSILKAI